MVAHFSAIRSSIRCAIRCSVRSSVRCAIRPTIRSSVRCAIRPTIRSSSRRFPFPTTLVALVALLALGLGLGSCSDSTQPEPTATDAAGQFEGNIDPVENSFVLRSLETPVPGEEPLRVELIGRLLTVEPSSEEISLEVAIRNVDRRPLYAPAEVVIFDLEPPVVTAVNADWTDCGDSTNPAGRPGECAYGFDYSDALGGDAALLSGETSEFRLWVFHAPDLGGFSFGAHVHFSFVAERPRIAGLFFDDRNENGHHDRSEGPFPGGWVEVTGPGVHGLRVRVGPDGRYAFPIHETGLYTLTGYPPPTASIAPVRFTTPNPLEVVILPGPGGLPQSYLEANFGLVTDLPPGDFPPVILIDEPSDSLCSATYNLARLSLEGNLLCLHVGYSGCQPEHPLQLFMVGGFMESTPVQARLILVHNDLGEMCDAYFERTLIYDLRPIQEAYAEAYGEPGIVILQFVDWHGETHPVEYAP